MVRYEPRAPSNQVLTALSVELYTQLRDKNNKVAGKYQEKYKSWTFPLDQYFPFVTKMGQIEHKNFENLELKRLPAGIETYLRKPTIPKQDIVLNLPSKMVNRLYPFQREGIRRIIDKSGRAILADEMGLGKTIQGKIYRFPVKTPLLISQLLTGRVSFFCKRSICRSCCL